MTVQQTEKLREFDPHLEHVTPDCHYCDEPLSVVKGGPQVNGLHADCAEQVSKEMNDAWGPVVLVAE
jgi:hypothetical protein